MKAQVLHCIVLYWIGIVNMTARHVALLVMEHAINNKKYIHIYIHT